MKSISIGENVCSFNIFDSVHVWSEKISEKCFEKWWCGGDLRAVYQRFWYAIPVRIFFIVAWFISLLLLPLPMWILALLKSEAFSGSLLTEIVFRKLKTISFIKQSFSTRRPIITAIKLFEGCRLSVIEICCSPDDLWVVGHILRSHFL